VSGLRAGPGWAQLVVVLAAVLSGGSMLVFGVWSLIWPRSFAAFIDFPPYNEHLLHDLGAFQIGIGVSVLVALVWVDALAVGLLAFSVAGGIHAVNHAVDGHLGGHGSDSRSLGLLALLTTVGLLIRLRGGGQPARAGRGAGMGREST
jgi:hypothetical protein